MRYIDVLSTTVRTASKLNKLPSKDIARESWAAVIMAAVFLGVKPA